MEKMSSFVRGYELSKTKLFNVLDNGCDGLLNDEVGNTFDISGIQVDGRADKDGVMKYRTILFTADGRAYASGSKSLKVKLERIVEVFGEPSEWEKPMKMQVYKEQVKNVKNPVLSVRIIED